jgi:uncharacterized protein YxjI
MMPGRLGNRRSEEQAEPTTRRDQRQEDRRDFGVGGSATRYKMKEKLVSFGDDFWIEDEGGRKAFKVDGKMIRVRDILAFEDDKGHVLVEMASKIVQIKDQVKLERKGGRGAVVKKDLINIVRDHFIMKIDGGEEIDIKGNFLDHEYSFTKGRDKIAEVSKKWFRVRDTYGVQIEAGEDDILILAATVAVDQLSHDTA